MEEVKNLVKDYLLEQKIILSDDYNQSFYYEDVEWHIYKEKDDILLYVSYDLTDQGLGYAFCVKVECKKFKYNISCSFYTKSFSNATSGEWEECPQKLKDKLLSDTIGHLKIYGN